VLDGNTNACITAPRVIKSCCASVNISGKAIEREQHQHVTCTSGAIPAAQKRARRDGNAKLRAAPHLRRPATVERTQRLHMLKGAVFEKKLLGLNLSSVSTHRDRRSTDHPTAIRIENSNKLTQMEPSTGLRWKSEGLSVALPPLLCAHSTPPSHHAHTTLS
jgi:hypothetical protein